MGNYRDLEVWQLARKLVADCYKFSKSLPEQEKFGLVAQIQRASISVPANIAEGSGRRTDPAFASFLRISLGSVYELETLILLSEDLGFCSSPATAELNEKLRVIAVKLNNLLNSLQPKYVRESLAEYGFDSSELEDRKD